MNNNLHFEILDKKRKSVLSILENFKDRFYLAGGTALALQIGHRDSIDFDFFTGLDFDNLILKQEIENIFVGHKINIIQLETNTLTCIKEVKTIVFSDFSE